MKAADRFGGKAPAVYRMQARCSMDMELIIVGLVVVAAAGFMLRRFLGARKGGGCSCGCNCNSACKARKLE